MGSVKQQADAARQELAALKSSHEALHSEVAVAKGRLSGFDESCQLSLDRVQSLSAALQEAQQAKVCTAQCAAYLIVCPQVAVALQCVTQTCGYCITATLAICPVYSLERIPPVFLCPSFV